MAAVNGADYKQVEGAIRQQLVMWQAVTNKNQQMAQEPVQRRSGLERKVCNTVMGAGESA